MAIFEFTGRQRKQFNSRSAANEPEATSCSDLVFDGAMENNAGHALGPAI
jgi:hypothetical protein